MKHYKTKTGVYLHCIEGGCQGDGIPRAKLSTAKSKNRFFDWLFTKDIFYIKIGSFEYKSEAA
jgi:hypothetical protein